MVVRVRAADGSVQTFPEGTDPAAGGEYGRHKMLELYDRLIAPPNRAPRR